MLNHEEQLPAEQAEPQLIQDLQSTYQLKPAEKQVLSRVHTRLAQYNGPLPSAELKPLAIDRRRFAPSRFSAFRPAMFEQKKHVLTTLVAVLVICFLFGSFALVLGHRSSSSSAGQPALAHITLVPSVVGSIPSRTEMQSAATILLDRLTGAGLRGSHVRVQQISNQSRILVDLPGSGSDQLQSLHTMQGKGVIGIWDTGHTSQGFLNVGATLDPKSYTLYNPGDVPLFTNQDIDLNSLSISKDPRINIYIINMAMRGTAVQRLSSFTGGHIGDYLTITLDNKVLMSAVVQSQLVDQFEITGNFTLQQAQAIVSTLKSGQLPIALEQLP